jgi:hypothetical protein
MRTIHRRGHLPHSVSKRLNRATQILRTICAGFRFLFVILYLSLEELDFDSERSVPRNVALVLAELDRCLSQALRGSGRWLLTYVEITYRVSFFVS